MVSTANNLETLNIFHLSPFPYYSGGIDTWLLNFLISFDGKYRIKIYCTSPNEDMIPIHDIQHFSTVEIIYIGRFSGHLSRIIWAFKAFKFLYNQFITCSKIIVLSTPPMLPIIFLKMFNRINGEIILSVRGQLSQDAIDMKKSIIFQKIVKFIEGRCISSADKIIANGWDTQDFIKHFFGKDSEVIPNGFLAKSNTEPIPNDGIEIVKELKKQGKIIISHVGTVRKMKCIDYILEAMKLLSNVEKEKSAFVFIGKGNLDYYSEIAQKLNVSAYFLGEKSNVIPYYKKSDFIINVSGGSGVSNSLIEALSIGRPVITWNNKTFTQIIKDGENGICCEHRNASSLAKGLKTAINREIDFNSDEIKLSVKDFQWSRVIPKWQKLLPK